MSFLLQLLVAVGFSTSCGKLQVQQLQLIGAMQNLSIGGKREAVVRSLSEHPRLFAVWNLIDDSEVETIKELARSQLKISTTHYRLAGGSSPATTWRQSDTAFLNTSTETAAPIIAKLNRRVSKLLNLSLRVIEKSEFQILRYRSPGYYHPHYDSRRLQDLSRKSNSHDDSWQYPVAARFATILYFLSNVEKGGNVTFPLARMGSIPLALSESLRSKNPKAREFWDSWSRVCDTSATALSIKPQKTMALLWYNHNVGPDGLVGELDPWSMHGGCDVGDGYEKWVANHWIRIPPKHSSARDKTVAADLAYKEVMYYFDRFSEALLPRWRHSSDSSSHSDL